MLGYNLGFPEEKSTYGPAEIGEQFWRSHLQCQGDEESLEDCGGKENPSCTRGEVAGVTCFLGGSYTKPEYSHLYLLQRTKLCRKLQLHLQQQLQIQLQLQRLQLFLDQVKICISRLRSTLNLFKP